MDRPEDDVGAKTTVVSSSHAKVVCERLQTQGYFDDAQGAFRFAVCFALAHHLEEDGSQPTEPGKGLTWSVTGLDPNQRLRFLVEQFSSGAQVGTQREAYQRVEQLGNVGLAEIGRRLDEGAFISDLVA
jgi:hypothetical protein